MAAAVWAQLLLFYGSSAPVEVSAAETVAVVSAVAVDVAGLGAVSDSVGGVAAESAAMVGATAVSDAAVAVVATDTAEAAEISVPVPVPSPTATSTGFRQPVYASHLFVPPEPRAYAMHGAGGAWYSGHAEAQITRPVAYGVRAAGGLVHAAPTAPVRVRRLFRASVVGPAFTLGASAPTRARLTCPATYTAAAAGGLIVPAPTTTATLRRLFRAAASGPVFELGGASTAQHRALGRDDAALLMLLLDDPPAWPRRRAMVHPAPARRERVPVLAEPAGRGRR